MEGDKRKRERKRRVRGRGRGRRREERVEKTQVESVNETVRGRREEETGYG